MSWPAPIRHLLVPCSLLAVVWLVFGLRDATFVSTGNTYAIFSAFSLYTLVAVGEGFTILMGEGDLSVGSVAALAGTMTVQLADIGLVPAVLVTTAALTIFGAFQGYVIHKVSFNSLVFTIGSLIGISGLAYIVSGNTTISLPVNDLTAGNSITQRLLDVFSPFSLIAIGFMAVSWFVLTYTRFGRELYALGGARREALAAGVSSRSRFIVAFACSAGFSALGGSLAAIVSGGAAPGGFANLLLSAITAVLVGGVALSGGAGSVIGIGIGAFTIQSIVAGVAIEGGDSNVSDLLTAGLLVCVLAIDVGARWSRRRRRRSAVTAS